MAPACAAPGAQRPGPGGGIEGPSEGAIEPIEKGTGRGIEGPFEGAIKPIEKGIGEGHRGPL